MSTSIVPSLQRQSKRWLSCSTIRNRSNSRHLSTGDGSGLVAGVTSEVMQQDPVVNDYVRSNFPKVFDPNIGSNKPTTNWGAERRALPKPPLNIRSMATIKRDPDTEEGSNRCYVMRKYNAMIPGLVYGGDPTQGISGGDLSKRIFVKTPTNLIQSELDRYPNSFESRVYDLNIFDSEEEMEAGEGGVIHRVVPRHVQLHPVNDTVYCCNYLRYYPGRPIKLPLLMINEEESPALKRDGYLIPINRYVECIIDEGVAIPEELEVECTGLKLKQVIRLDRVIFPDGVRPSKRVVNHKDFMIGPIHGGGKGDDEDGENQEAAAAAGEAS